MTRLLFLVLTVGFLAACQPKVDTTIGEITLTPPKPAQITGTVPARGNGGVWRLRFYGVGMSANPDPVAVTLVNHHSRPIQINVRGGKPAIVEPKQSREIYRGQMRGLYRAGRWRTPEFDISANPDAACKIGLTFDTMALTAPLDVKVFAVRPASPPPAR